ncbi:permease-like cell division protein FtsX [Streptosporangium sandarakinum]|uniref:permease-like cell division protein FtsX n=1 Tax=Streptosporangium sandarakinum TaxID=1260955 RepID=UPI003D901E5C
MSTDRNITEDRLRGALSAAAGTVADVRPLAVPVRRRTRLPMRIAAAALAVTAVAVGVTSLAAPSPRPGEAMVVAMAAGGTGPSGMADVSVFLCKDQAPFPNCGGKGVTEAGREELRRTLAGRPEVESVTFEDQRTNWENFRRQNADDTALLNVIRREDMPEAFRLRVKPGTDSLALTRAAGGLPGVSNAVDTRCLLEKGSLWGIVKSRLPWSDDSQQCSFLEMTFPDATPSSGG